MGNSIGQPVVRNTNMWANGDGKKKHQSCDSSLSPTTRRGRFHGSPGGGHQFCRAKVDEPHVEVQVGHDDGGRRDAAVDGARVVVDVLKPLGDVGGDLDAGPGRRWSWSWKSAASRCGGSSASTRPTSAASWAPAACCAAAVST
jgi:hypothetical protein